MTRTALGLFWLLAACNDKDKNPGDTGNVGETGDSSPDDSTATDDSSGGDDSTVIPCETKVNETIPEEDSDESVAWFYRDPLFVTFSDDASAATVVLYGPDGAEVPTTKTWSDGNFQVEITPDTPLLGSTTYTLHMEVCEYSGDLVFTTSVYGSALEESADALVGNTYVFNLSQAEILKPEGIGPLLSSYLKQPLLIGVDHADASVIGLIGSQGKQKDDGTYVQDGTTIWTFPDADFTTNPYFSAATDAISIDYYGTDIPLESFTLAGTFAPDGGSIGSAEASGLGDTRNMGPLLDLGDDPNAVCGLVDSLGLPDVACEPCADGEPYCLYLEVRFDDAELEEGLILSAG